MNKVYRVIWNESLGAWVAVSELSKSKTKSSKTRTIGSVIAAGLMLTFSAGAIAAGAPMTTCTPLDLASIFNSNSLFGQNIVCAWNTTNSTLVGNNITAAGNGVNLVAVGNNISTGGERSTVLGSKIIHSGRFTTVIGQNIKSRTEHSIVMGEDTTIDGGNYDISIGGNQNILNSQHTVALGNNINTSGSINSLAAGNDTTITNSRLATAVGDRASVTDSTASSAFGAGSSIIKADHSTAVGEGASVNKSNSSFAGGENASITGGYGNIAIGFTSTVSNTFGSSAIGYQSSVTGNSRGMALGTQAKVTDSDRGTALGASASVTNSASASASGNNASVTDSSYAQADGAGAKVTSSKSATAVGNDAIVTNSGSATAVGNGAKITDSYQAQAYGTGNSITNSNQASAFGVNSSITSSASGVAIGNNAKLNSAADGIAIGSSADVTSVANGIAIGKNAAVTTANSVALGANSTTSNAVATESATVGSITYGGFVGKSPVGVVSVGSQGKERQITNVAAGQITANSTDAINGSQLYSTQKALGNLASSTSSALGGNSNVQPDGSLSLPTYVITNNPKTPGTKVTVHTVGDALSALDSAVNVPLVFKGNTGNDITKKLGDTLSIKGDLANADTATATNLRVDEENGELKIKLARNLTDLDSVTVGGPTGPSITTNGINAGDKKITNVADGGVSTTSKDAINGSQLNTVKETAEKGWNFTATNGTTISAADTVKPGETLDFANTDGNIGITSADNKLTFNLAKDIKVGSVTAGDTVVKNDGITIVGGPSVTKTGIDAAGKKITNVAAGTATTDAVNVSQLTPVVDALGGGASLNNDGTIKAPSYTVNNATVNNVGDAIKALDKGWTVNSNGKLGAGTAVKAGDSVDIGVATGEQNLITTAKTANGKTVIDFALAKDLKVDSVNAGGTVINNNGLSFVDANGGALATAPSITKTGIDAGGNKITNVAAGDVSTTSKDAINGSQLNTVKETAEKGWNFTATNGTTTSAVDTVKPGETLDFANTDGNIGITSADNKLTFNLAKDIKVDSVTAGDTVVKNDGITIVGGPSVTKTGIDAAGKKITNVAAGTATTDGVNVSQLKPVVDALGGGSAINTDGTIKAPSYTVNNAAVNNVGDAIKALDKGWTVNSNGKLGAGTAVKAGDQVDIGVATGEQNLTTTAKTANGKTVIDFALAKDLKVDSVNAGGTVINNNGLSFVDANGNALAKAPSIKKDGIDAGGNKITNVADGDVSTTSKDAINGSQLNTVKETAEKGWNFTATNGTTTSAVDTVKPGETLDFANTDGNIGITSADNKLTFNLAKNIKVDSVTAGDTVVKNDGITIVGGPSVTKTGIDAAGKKITNVAAGTATTDAVNVSQLTPVVDALGGGASLNNDGTIKAPSYTVNNATVNNVGDAIKALDKGWTVNSNGKLGAGTAVKAGDSVDIGVATGEQNLTTTAKTENGTTVIGFALAKNLELGPNGSVAAGNTRFDSTGIWFAKDPANPSSPRDTNKPAVLDTGIDAGGNKITNVAAGDVSTTSKDAINGSQLNTVKETAEKGWNFTATNGTTTSVADTVKPGETLDFANTDGNIGITSADNKLTFNLAKNIKVDSVTAGDTVVKNDGITIVGGPSVTKTGINAGDKKITNVLAGDVNDASKDAVNGSQLYKTSSSVANALGGGSVVNPDGTVKAPSYTVNNAAVNNVGDAIKALDKGWTVNADAKLGAGQAVKAGDSVDIGVADDEKNITVAAKTADGKTVIDFALAKDLKVDSVNAGGTVINNNGLSFVDANGVALAKTPSIKKDGIDAGGNKITNVADGGVSTTSKDAINGSQLNTVKETAEKGWNFTATNGTTISAADTVKPGETLDFANTDGNIGITSADNKLTFNLAKDIKVDSVTAGDTVVNNNGITIVGGPSVTKTGIDAAGKKITNVAPGTISKDSKDAINGSQIYNLGNNVTNLFGGNASYDGDHITWNNIGGTGKNNIDDAIKSIGDQAATANKGWNLATDQGTASNVKPNDLVNINGDKASGIVVSNTGNNVTIGLSDKVKVGDKVSIDGTTGEINAGQIKIDGNKGTINNLNNTTWNGPNNIVSGQAATEDQLAQVVNNVNNQTTAAKTEVTQGDNIVVTASKAADGHSIYNVSTAKDVKFDSVTSNVVQVGNVKIDKDGINAGGQKVTNVAAGKVSTTSTDAVNGSQLYGYAEGVKNIIGGTTTYNPETGKYTNSDIGGTGKDNINDAIGAVNNSVINLGDRIDNAFYQTYKRIDKVEKEANAGIASAMAMETAPFIAGKWTYAVGAAYHGGEQAVGATLRKTADNGRWSLTGGVATGTEGDPSVRIGISGVID